MVHFLEVKNVTKEYGYSHNILYALKGISFHMNRGDFIVITGRSGSGKTTLLKIIAGLLESTSGEILINNTNISTMDEESRTIYRCAHIGYIFQDYNLIPSLNIADNLILPLQLNGSEVDKELFDEVVRMLELDNRLETMPYMLSGGQQQRAAIARALLMKPEVILADEPTGNLDRATEEKVLSLLKETSERFHQTVIMITHNEKIAAYADKCLHIEDGVLIG